MTTTTTLTATSMGTALLIMDGEARRQNDARELPTSALGVIRALGRTAYLSALGHGMTRGSVIRAIIRRADATFPQVSALHTMQRPLCPISTTGRYPIGGLAGSEQCINMQVRGPRG